MNKVKKAVIPIAGYGTRFLPYTKAVPKAMLPILNRPALDVITDEAIKSGITEILFVVGYKKETIQDYFIPNKELEDVLVAGNKLNPLNYLRQIGKNVTIKYVEQTELNGNAKAIELGREFVGNEPFAVMFGDDVMHNDENPVIGQLIKAYEKTGKSVIGCQNVSREDVTKYASVEYDKVDGNMYNAVKITEKPKLEDVKSTLSPLGRYVLTPEIFDIIDNLNPGVSNEYQISDALDILAKNNKLTAIDFYGTRYDMGSLLGYLKANVEYSLRNDRVNKEFKEYLIDLVGKF